MADDEVRERARALIAERRARGMTTAEIAADKDKIFAEASASPTAGSHFGPGLPPEGDTAGDYLRAFRGGAADQATLGGSSPQAQLAEAEQYDRDTRGSTDTQSVSLDDLVARGAGADPGREEPTPEARAAQVRQLGRGTVTPSYESAQQNAYSVSRNPIVALLGGLAAAPISLGTQAAKGIGRAIAPVSRGGKIVLNSLAGGGGAAGEAVARARIEGGSWPEALLSGAQAFGAGAALGGGASTANSMIRNPRAMSGQYVEGLEYGKNTGYLKSKEVAGPSLFEDPATVPAGAPKDFRGVGAESRRLSDKLAQHNQDQYKEMNREWEAAVDHPARHLPDDISQFVGDMNASVKRYSASGRPVDKAVAAEVEEAVKNLSTEVPQYGPVPPPPAPPRARQAPPIERRMIEDGLNRYEATDPTTAATRAQEANPNYAMDAVVAALEGLPDRRRGGMAGGNRQGLQAPRQETALMRRPSPEARTEYQAPPAEAAPGPDPIVMQQTGTINRPIATLDDLITQKQRWKALAEYGQMATKDNLPYRQLYDAAREATKRIANEHPNPEFRAAAQQQVAADDVFATKATDLEDTNSRLFGKEDAGLQNTVGEQRRGANELLQVIKDTQASGTRMADFDALRAKPGLVGEIVKQAHAKMSDEATKISLSPKTFAHTGSWGGAPIEQVTQGLKVRLAEPFTRQGRHGGLGATQIGAQGGRHFPAALGGYADHLRDPIEAIIKSLGKDENAEKTQALLQALQQQMLQKKAEEENQ